MAHGSKLRFRTATPADAPELAALHNSVAGALAARYGDGHWVSHCTERSCAQGMKHAVVRVGCMRLRSRQRILTALTLANKKPWAIDASCFTPVKRAIYLTGMATAVAHQRTGLGRQALKDAIQVARDWPAQAIRLDAYDVAAGAGAFYAECGFVERGRATYRGSPLIYFEFLLWP